MMNKSKDQTKIQDTKLAPPPKNLPIYGRGKPEFTSYVAWSNYEAALEQRRFLFGVRRRDLRRNTIVLGRPGMGKTKFLQAMVRQDIAHGYGCCVLDFRGGLVKALIEDIPEERMDDVLILDPSNPKLRSHINPLDGISKDFIYPFIRTVEDTLSSMYPQLWNPQLEYLVHNIFATVLSTKQPTLRLVYDILVDPEIRQAITDLLENESLKNFWLNTYPRWESDHEAEAVLPLMNILRGLVLHPTLKDIYDAPGNSMPLSKLVSKRKILLIRLEPDRVGDIAATFFGTLILARYLEIAQNRPPEDTDNIRKDYLIYLDEFPHLDNSLVQNFLATGGDRGLPFVVAMNSTLSVSTDTTQKLLAKADNLFCFRLFGEDASRMKSEMLPIFDTRDLQNLGPREIYCRIVIEEELSNPFSAETLEVMAAPNAVKKHDLVEHVYDRHGIPDQGIY